MWCNYPRYLRIDKGLQHFVDCPIESTTNELETIGCVSCAIFKVVYFYLVIMYYIIAWTPKNVFWFAHINC
jgi:hypothetical protein